MKNTAAIVAAFIALGAATFAFNRSQHMAAPLEPVKKLWVAVVLQGVMPIDFKTGKADPIIHTGLLPHNMVLSPDGKTLYVTNVGSQCVSAIDVATERKVKDILVGEVPDNPYHRKLGAERMAKVNNCSECHAAQAVGTLPNAIAFDGPGKHLMVNESRARRITWLDPEIGKTMKSVAFDSLPDHATQTPANIAVAPNGEIWVLHRFQKTEDGRSPKFGSHGMNDFQHDPPAGQHTTWITIHNADMTQELGRISTQWAVPFAAQFSPDGKWLYVAYRSTNIIAVFDTANRKLARTIETSIAPTGLAISKDGSELYTTCLFARPPVVQVIDAASGQIKVSLGVPPSPSLVITDPLTGLLYVTATGYNAVLEIDPAQRKMLRQIPAGHQPLSTLLTR